MTSLLLPGHKYEAKPRLFLDMDGVLADFDGHYLASFGKDLYMDEVSNKEMWNNIFSTEDYFLQLPLMNEAQRLFRELTIMSAKGDLFGLYILTSCPHSKFMQVAQQKMQWIRKHLSRYAMVIPTNGREAKVLYMQGKGDILVDDYGKNCLEWQAHGGTAVKHRDVDVTLELVEQVLRGDVEWQKAA